MDIFSRGFADRAAADPDISRQAFSTTDAARRAAVATTAWLLDQLAFSDSGANGAEGLLRSALANNGSNKPHLARALVNLTDAQRSLLQSRVPSLQRLISLSHETNPRLFAAGLLDWAADHPDAAGLVCGLFSQRGPNGEPYLPGADEALCRRAAAMLGQGSLEFSLKRIVRGSTEIDNIVPMVLGTVVAGAVRIGALAKFAGMTETWYARGRAAKLTAGLLAYATEVPTLALSSLALSKLEHNSAGGIGSGLADAAVILGALKFGVSMGNRAFSGLHAINELGQVGRLRAWLGWTQPLLNQGAVFAGMLLGRKAEERLRLRDPRDNATAVADTVTSMFSAGTGAYVGEKVFLGGAYARWQGGMTLRLEWAEREAAESLEHAHSRSRNLQFGPMWMAAGAETGGVGEGKNSNPVEFPLAHLADTELKPTIETSEPPIWDFYGVPFPEGAGALVKGANNYRMRAERVDVLNFGSQDEAHVEAAGVHIDVVLNRRNGELSISVKNPPQGTVVHTFSEDYRRNPLPLIPGESRNVKQGSYLQIDDAQGQAHDFELFSPRRALESAATDLRARAAQLAIDINAPLISREMLEHSVWSARTSTLADEAYALEMRIKGLSAGDRYNKIKPRSPEEIKHDIAELEAKRLAIIGEHFHKGVEGSKEALGRLIALSEDSHLQLRYDKFISELLSKKMTDFDGIKSFQEYYISLFRRAMEHQAATEWRNSGGTGDFPTVMVSREFQKIIETQFDMGLLADGLDENVVREFVSELVSFHKNFPPPENRGYGLNGFLMDQHLLLGEKPSTNTYLEAITQNLRGYQAAFKDHSGVIFHRQGRVIQELRVPDPTHSGKKTLTGLFFVVERGHGEYNNGMEIAIYDGEPKVGQGPDKRSPKRIFKIGVHFGKDKALRIVNIQGVPSNYYRKISEYQKTLNERVQAITGGANPLDMMVGSVIFWGRQRGFSKVEGIKDAAQVARKDKVESSGWEGNAFYDLLFKRMGFEKPMVDSDYWTLDLETLKIRRKRFPKPLEEAEGLGGHRYQITTGDNTPGQYFRQILTRPIWDSTGKRVRPEKWDVHTPQPLAKQVVAFWKVMVPTFSEARFQPFPGAAEVPENDTPLQPLNIKPASRTDQANLVATKERETPIQ